MRQREALQVYLYQLVHGERSGILVDILLGLLRVFSLLYGLGVIIKLALYKYGILKQHKLNCRVISLGNITVGGTGKTPTAQRLAAMIRDMGYKVVILNRGYRASFRGEVGLVSDGRKIYMSVTEAGDEAYLLAKSLRGVSVVIGRDRRITGQYAVEKLKAEVVILDDGYQHWQLARDLDIVLIDTLNVFGNNFLLPRGTLREPLSNLTRADAFLLSRVDQSSDDSRGNLRTLLARYNAKAPVVESTHTPQCFLEIEEWYKGIQFTPIALDTIRGKKVMAVSAIGNPFSFEQTIADIGAAAVDSNRFPDHHDYTMAEMQQVMEKAVQNEDCVLIITDKDAVKIPAEFIHSDRQLPMYVLSIKLNFVDGYDDLMSLIENVTGDK
ncbi:MAG: tetraacyldisaccharide 4'-kinase [Veillonellales bacterium]